MVEGTTTSGFKFSLDEEKIDDMEFVELLAEVDDDFTKLPKVIDWALGESQKKRLYEHLKEKFGRASMAKTNEELGEIFEAAGDTIKNLFNSQE